MLHRLAPLLPLAVAAAFVLVPAVQADLQFHPYDTHTGQTPNSGTNLGPDCAFNIGEVFAGINDYLSDPGSKNIQLVFQAINAYLSGPPVGTYHAGIDQFGVWEACPAPVKQVSITGSQFVTQHVNIIVHSQVHWTNMDLTVHSVVSDSAAFEPSASLSQNEVFVVEFDSVGVFAYHCGVHPGMTGSVTVVAA